MRDNNGLIPIRLESSKRIAAVIPIPGDLTPADTSSYIHPQLAESLREHHPRVDEFNFPLAPSDDDCAGLVQALRDYDLIVLGSINAVDHPGQVEFIRSLLKTGVPAIVVAMRLPYDLLAFPEAPTYLCTYGIQEPSMKALADALFGRQQITGRLPVSIPGLYPAG